MAPIDWNTGAAQHRDGLHALESQCRAGARERERERRTQPRRGGSFRHGDNRSAAARQFHCNLEVQRAVTRDKDAPSGGNTVAAHQRLACASGHNTR